MSKAKKQELSHTGSTFESFLEEEGVRNEVQRAAIKRVLEWKSAQPVKEQKKTKVRRW